MSIALHIKASLELPMKVVLGYLDDLTEEDLLVRVVPEDRSGGGVPPSNHIAWQLGHLIASENFHISQVYPNSMPLLPDGFRDKHSTETASSDKAADFYRKEEYINFMHQQRDGTLSVLDGLSDDELLKPAPESIQYFGPTIGSIFSGESAHWMMHAGQWALIRRSLGRPPLY